MEENLSASARRALESAARWAAQLAASQIHPIHLLVGIGEQEESRGARLLSEMGWTAEKIRGALALPSIPLPTNAATAAVAPSDTVRQIVQRAGSRRVPQGDAPGTDVLLFELLDLEVVRQQLSTAGFDADVVHAKLGQELALESEPLTAEFAVLQVGEDADTVDALRIVDAAANRALEGLRVLEDYTRFARDDAALTAELKGIRHAVRKTLDYLPNCDRLACRNTEEDVGTSISAPTEWSRTQTLDVAAANFKRVQEALRSLEEFSKLEGRQSAEAFKRLRYRMYTMERMVMLSLESDVRLLGVALCAVISSKLCTSSLEWTVRESIAGGVHAVQLREKSMDDRSLIELARKVRRWTRESGTLMVMNDRPDIARLVDADGAHLGQDDLTVKDARRIVGPNAIIGVSTHSIEQVRQAVLDGANYIGVGPTFPTTTKSFDAFPGLDLIRRQSAEVRLPAFAIGGIVLANVDQVLAAGARRIAVSSAICSSRDPRQAAAEFRSRLDKLPRN